MGRKLDSDIHPTCNANIQKRRKRVRARKMQLSATIYNYVPFCDSPSACMYGTPELFAMIILPVPGNNKTAKASIIISSATARHHGIFIRKKKKVKVRPEEKQGQERKAWRYSRQGL